MTPLIQQAKTYACATHAARNLTYDGHPYAYHLEMVFEVATQYLECFFCHNWTLLGKEETSEEGKRNAEIVLAGCWVHDLLEDTGVSYNDVVRATSEDIAEISYLLQTPKGRTREDRHCPAYYEEILTNPAAQFVKVCDRMANIRHGRQTQSRMLGVYRKEHPKFVGALKLEGSCWAPMMAEMSNLLDLDKNHSSS